MNILKEIKSELNVIINNDAIYDVYNPMILDNVKSINTIIDKIKSKNVRFNPSKYVVNIKYNTDDTDDNIYKILKTYQKSSNTLFMIKRLFKEYVLDYDYANVFKRTKLYDKEHLNSELAMELGGGGKSYDYVVYNFKSIYEDNYIISANKYTNKAGITTKTLTFNLKYSGCYTDFDNTIADYNKEFKDVLKNCYDNVIILDFGFDVIFVIELLPMYKYFNLIENEKNNYFQVKPYHYQDDRFYRFVYKNINDENRNECDILSFLDFDGKDEFMDYYKKYDCNDE